MLIMMMKINIMVVKVIRNTRDVIIISTNIVNIGKAMNFGVMEIKTPTIMITTITILELHMDTISQGLNFVHIMNGVESTTVTMIDGDRNLLDGTRITSTGIENRLGQHLKITNL